MNYLLIILIPTIYFLISWNFPWDKIQFNSSISVTYIFDLLFTVIIYLSFKFKNITGNLNIKGTAVRSLTSIIISSICIFIISKTSLISPFKFIEHQALQLLILAPILEEGVFRGAFMGVFLRLRLRRDISVTLSTMLFSLSHATGFWFLPSEFHSFIVFQMFYTIILGALCSKSRLKTLGILEPIIIHFLFNLVFYVGVKFFTI